MNRRKFLGYMGCACCSLMLPSCTTAPITERKQLKLISEASLNAKAAKIYEKVKNKENRFFPNEYLNVKYWQYFLYPSISKYSACN